MDSLLTHRTTAGREATVEVDTSDLTAEPVEPNLFGKFGEHLYMVGMDEMFNAKNAFEAQLLHNATLASWKFQAHDNAVDGGRPAIHDPEEIEERVEGYADVHDFPDAERMHAAYQDGTALWWFPVGDESAVRTSPDVGTADDRAQRIEVDGTADGPTGLGQWCYLPLHRTRGFEGKLTARAVEPVELTVALHEVAEDGTFGERLDSATVAVGEEYETLEFDLELPEGVDDSADALYGCSVTTEETANVVLDRLLLYPDDHVHTADPELVEFLRDSDLPVFRWPGGNFVSGYDWRDGVGPIEERPTKPNPAWDGVESNLFGTAEFVEFCEAVGCEPMICLNAGDGTAEEAAKWVEYCNGSTDTEMGALRAEHGYPEPFDVTYWEVGNEVYGEWQVTWTTPEGNADRYERFHEAMIAVDDDIEVMACGNRLTDWNDPLLERVPEIVEWITDHVLVGSGVSAADDPEELFNAYMALAKSVLDQYDDLEDRMAEAGIEDPKVAITELQLFAFGEDDEVTVPTSASITEALFSATFVHEAVRSDGPVEMITHSGLGNHGGGIQKHKERVWGHPCYHYHSMGSRLFEGTPLLVDLECDTYATESAFSTDTPQWMDSLDPVSDVPVLDPIAVRSADGEEVIVDLLHRDSTAETIETTIELDGQFSAAQECTVTVLSGEAMDQENTFENPEHVTPATDAVEFDGDAVTVEVDPLSITRVVFHEA